MPRYQFQATDSSGKPTQLEQEFTSPQEELNFVSKLKQQGMSNIGIKALPDTTPTPPSTQPFGPPQGFEAELNKSIREGVTPSPETVQAGRTFVSQLPAIGLSAVLPEMAAARYAPTVAKAIPALAGVAPAAIRTLTAGGAGGLGGILGDVVQRVTGGEPGPGMGERAVKEGLTSAGVQGGLELLNPALSTAGQFAKYLNQSYFNLKPPPGLTAADQSLLAGGLRRAKRAGVTPSVVGIMSPSTSEAGVGVRQIAERGGQELTSKLGPRQLSELGGTLERKVARSGAMSAAATGKGSFGSRGEKIIQQYRQGIEAQIPDEAARAAHYADIFKRTGIKVEKIVGRDLSKLVRGNRLGDLVTLTADIPELADSIRRTFWTQTFKSATKGNILNPSVVVKSIDRLDNAQLTQLFGAQAGNVKDMAQLFRETREAQTFATQRLEGAAVSKQTPWQVIVSIAAAGAEAFKQAAGTTLGFGATSPLLGLSTAVLTGTPKLVARTLGTPNGIQWFTDLMRAQKAGVLTPQVQQGFISRFVKEVGPGLLAQTAARAYDTRPSESAPTSFENEMNPITP